MSNAVGWMYRIYYATWVTHILQIGNAYANNDDDDGDGSFGNNNTTLDSLDERFSTVCTPASSSEKFRGNRDRNKMIVITTMQSHDFAFFHSTIRKIDQIIRLIDFL